MNSNNNAVAERDYSSSFEEISNYPFREDELITSGQRRKLHDLIFQQFDDYATIQQCLSHIEGLTRSEAGDYINSFEF
ncbi:MAG: hypothetical protein WCO84_02520 [bacterium]